MKGRIEDRYLGHSRDTFKGNFDPKEIGWIMEWRQRNHSSDGFNHVFRYQSRFMKRFSTVYNSVTDSEQFGRILQSTGFPHGIGDEPEAVTMIGNRLIGYFLIEVTAVSPHAMGQPARGFSDPFEDTGSEHEAGVHCEELIFDGRAARVDDEDFHSCSPKRQQMNSGLSECRSHGVMGKLDTAEFQYSNNPVLHRIMDLHFRN